MPIGKDSITKRVAKTEEPAETVVADTVAEETKVEDSAEVKPEASKKAPAKKTAKVATNVMGSVSPETTKKVLGHKEGAKVLIIGIGEELPVYLL